MKINDFGHCAILIPENAKEKAWLKAGEGLGLVWWDNCCYGFTQRMATTEGWQKTARTISIQAAAENPSQVFTPHG